MPATLRSSGIPSMDEVPWGSHLCLFYETQDDLIDTASCYFAPGLESGELCVWALPDHVSPATAQERLRDTVGGFDEYIAAGRLRLIGRDEWHGNDETFDVARIAALWAGLIDEALGDVPHRAGGAKLLYVREGVNGKRYREGVQAALDAEGLAAVEQRLLQAAALIAAAEFEGALELEQFGGYGTIPRLRLHRVRAVSSD